MKLNRQTQKSSSQEISEDRLERRLHQQDFEHELIKLIDRLPDGNIREGLKSRQLDNLDKCEREIAELQKELRKN